MKERHIDELFLNSDFHTKVIFENKLTIWQNKLVSNCFITIEYLSLKFILQKDLNVSIGASTDSSIEIWMEANRKLLKRRNVTCNKFECSTPSTSNSVLDDVRSD